MYTIHAEGNRLPRLCIMEGKQIEFDTLCNIHTRQLIVKVNRQVHLRLRRPTPITRMALPFLFITFCFPGECLPCRKHCERR